MGIRWRKKDEVLLKKKVQNFNNKVNRLNAKKDYKGVVPEKINYKDYKKSITNRKQFNILTKDLELFTKRGSERIVQTNKINVGISEYQQKVIERKLKIINKERRKLSKKLENLPRTNRGKEISTPRNIDHAMEQLEDKKFNFNWMKKGALKEFIKDLDKFEYDDKKREEQYRDSLMKAYRNDMTDKEYSEIEKLFEGIDTDTLIVNYYKDDVLNIGFWYEETNREVKVRAIIQGWNEIANKK